jgi:hypothetical protein
VTARGKRPGQYLSLGVTEKGTPTAGDVRGATVKVLRPDGIVLAQGTLNPTIGAPQFGYQGSMTVNTGPVPSTGTYTVLVEQTEQWAGSATTFAFALSTPVSGTLSINSPITSANSYAGQGWRYTFSGTAAQTLTLTVTENSSQQNSGDVRGATVQVLRPDNSVLAQGTLNPTLGSFGYAGSVTLSTGSLPSTGTYTVLVQQTEVWAGTATFGFSLTNP